MFIFYMQSNLYLSCRKTVPRERPRKLVQRNMDTGANEVDNINSLIGSKPISDIVPPPERPSVRARMYRTSAYLDY